MLGLRQPYLPAANVPPSRPRAECDKLRCTVTTTRARSFTFQGLIGQGGFGQVYRAILRTASGLELVVAVKLLRADLRPGSSAAARLRDEARLLGQIQHPAILSVRHVVSIRSRLGIVSDFIDGDDLSAVLRSGGALAPRIAATIVSEVASALHTAWTTRTPEGRALCVVHRDVKPSNIRIGRFGDVKLIDFGIAQCADVHREAKTATGILVGSARYLAPERYTERVATHKADVFSLGCCLYECLTGTPFHTTKSVFHLASLSRDHQRFGAHLEERLSHLPASSHALLPLLRTMLQGEPHRRPTAKTVSDDCHSLSRVLEGPVLRAWCAARTWDSQPEDCSLGSQPVFEDPSPQHVSRPDLTTVAPVSTPNRDTPFAWIAMVASVLAMAFTVAALGFLWWNLSALGMML